MINEHGGCIVSASVGDSEVLRQAALTIQGWQMGALIRSSALNPDLASMMMDWITEHWLRLNYSDRRMINQLVSEIYNHDRIYRLQHRDITPLGTDDQANKWREVLELAA